MQKNKAITIKNSSLPTKYNDWTMRFSETIKGGSIGIVNSALDAKLSDRVFDSPQLNEFYRANKEDCVAFLKTILANIRDLYSVKYGMNDIQLAVTVKTIVKEYWYLRVDEFLYFFRLVASGTWEVFNRIDGQIIISWLKDYDINYRGIFLEKSARNKVIIEKQADTADPEQLEKLRKLVAEYMKNKKVTKTKNPILKRKTDRDIWKEIQEYQKIIRGK